MRWERVVEEKEGRDVVQIISLLRHPKTTRLQGHDGQLINSSSEESQSERHKTHKYGSLRG